MVEFAQVYIETSVVLRWTLRQPGAVHGVQWISAFSSELTAVESRRALDCLRLTKTLSRRRLAEFRDDADRSLAKMNLLALDQRVLKRAGEPFPTPLKTLDAIHLATALLLNDDLGGGIVLLTHDRQLGVAALACGLTVHPDPVAP
jgi:predicted nucleic acid-binding protein